MVLGVIIRFLQSFEHFSTDKRDSRRFSDDVTADSYKKYNLIRPPQASLFNFSSLGKPLTSVENPIHYGVALLKARCQFHQYFTISFFVVQKCHALFLCTYRLCLYFLAKEIGEKAACKMLVKLISELHLN